MPRSQDAGQPRKRVDEYKVMRVKGCGEIMMVGCLEGEAEAGGAGERGRGWLQRQAGWPRHHFPLVTSIEEVYCQTDCLLRESRPVTEQSGSRLTPPLGRGGGETGGLARLPTRLQGPLPSLLFPPPHAADLLSSPTFLFASRSLQTAVSRWPMRASPQPKRGLWALVPRSSYAGGKCECESRGGRRRSSIEITLRGRREGG